MRRHVFFLVAVLAVCSSAQQPQRLEPSLAAGRFELSDKDITRALAGPFLRVGGASPAEGGAARLPQTAEVWVAKAFGALDDRLGIPVGEVHPGAPEDMKFFNFSKVIRDEALPGANVLLYNLDGIRLDFGENGNIRRISSRYTKLNTYIDVEDRVKQALDSAPGLRGFFDGYYYLVNGRLKHRILYPELWEAFGVRRQILASIRAKRGPFPLKLRTPGELVELRRYGVGPSDNAVVFLVRGDEHLAPPRSFYIQASGTERTGQSMRARGDHPASSGRWFIEEVSKLVADPGIKRIGLVTSRGADLAKMRQAFPGWRFYGIAGATEMVTFWELNWNVLSIVSKGKVVACFQLDATPVPTSKQDLIATLQALR